MVDNKRKRGRTSKSRVPETLDLQTSKATSSSPSVDDVDLTLNNDVPNSNHDHHLRRRRKPSVHTVENPKTPQISSPRIETNGDVSGNGSLLDSVVMAMARVMPAMDAVVKVFCTHTEPNFSLPWQRKRQYSSSSSGFVISGRRVLTNAHSVDHYTQVKLKKRGSDTKYVATVLAVGTECDIALLTVDDDEFWLDVSPVEFGDLPALQDAVTVVGYPIGGDTISVTSGVVSRIEILSYVHGSTELLGLQMQQSTQETQVGPPSMTKETALELHFNPSNMKMLKTLDTSYQLLSLHTSSKIMRKTDLTLDSQFLGSNGKKWKILIYESQWE